MSRLEERAQPLGQAALQGLGAEGTLSHPVWFADGSLKSVRALMAELELESGSPGPRPAFPPLHPHHRRAAASRGPEGLSDLLLIPLATPNSPFFK